MVKKKESLFSSTVRIINAALFRLMTFWTLSIVLLLIKKNNFLETGLWLSSQVKAYSVGPYLRRHTKIKRTRSGILVLIWGLRRNCKHNNIRYTTVRKSYFALLTWLVLKCADHFTARLLPATGQRHSMYKIECKDRFYFSHKCIVENIVAEVLYI
jgi:hypothetical protein